MFSPQLRWKSLAVLCDSLAKLLGAGVEIRRAFSRSAKKSSDPKCARAVEHIVDGFDRGLTVSEGMREQEGVFPEMMVDLVDVAEQTGMLPEILEHLAAHYQNSLRLRRAFVSQITWPVLQFVAAILIVALMIVVMGWIPAPPGTKRFDPLGFGLFGVPGALVWLAWVFGTLFVLFVTYQLVTRLLAGKALVHALLLKIPVVGHCSRSFAIARFSWTFYLTQQTGMPIERAIESSLKATGNGAFIAATPDVLAAVREGEELTFALDDTGLFPRDYIEMVSVGETTGTVPETLERLFPQFEESARRSLSALSTALGWVVWGLVAAFITFFVFRIVLSYIAMVNDLAGGL